MLLYQQQPINPSCNMLCSTLWGNSESLTQLPGVRLACRLPEWNFQEIYWDIIIKFTQEHKQKGYCLCRQSWGGYPLHDRHLLLIKFMYVLQNASERIFTFCFWQNGVLLYGLRQLSATLPIQLFKHRMLCMISNIEGHKTVKKKAKSNSVDNDASRWMERKFGPLLESLDIQQTTMFFFLFFCPFLH